MFIYVKYIGQSMVHSWSDLLVKDQPVMCTFRESVTLMIIYVKYIYPSDLLI